MKRFALKSAARAFLLGLRTSIVVSHQTGRVVGAARRRWLERPDRPSDAIGRILRPRVTLAARLLSVLCAVAALSTGLALLVQDRSLSSDLRGAAELRLERASFAANRLLDQKLDALSERFATISREGPFRDNMLGDFAALSRYAKDLATRTDVALVLFLGTDGQLMASAGKDDLANMAGDIVRAGRTGAAAPPGGASGQRRVTADLVSRGDVVYAMANVPIGSESGGVTDLVVLEKITAHDLAEWSDLCGADLTVGDTADHLDVALPVRDAGELGMCVSLPLEAEREALANSRQNLLLAGTVALILAFAASYFVAHGLVRPIRAIQMAAERIGEGDLEFRLNEERQDEVGDVARAFNLMLERLDMTQGRLANAQRLARLGNWGIDLRTGELHGSKEFQRIFGFEASVAPLTFEYLLRCIHRDDRNAFRSAFWRCRNHGKIIRLDHRATAKDGTERVLHTYAERVDGGNAIEGTVQDISDRKRVEDQIRYLAYHDSLTGLGNRRLLKERLGLALEQARRADSKVAVLYLDLDRFKGINDTLGHSAGDQLLVEVADRLVRCVRAASNDTGPGRPQHASLVARLGGDEFTVLLTDIRRRTDIENYATRILHSFAPPFEVKGQEVTVGASIGITLAPDDAKDVETLLRNSDTAMYHAKTRGASAYQFYNDSMHEEAAKRLVLENKLRRAIENQEFELLYQPKVELQTRQVSGVEALLRWRDPQLGIIGPEEFIPLAEETGAVVPIGEWVLRSAMNQAVAWLELGLPPMRVAVNLSVHQMEEHVGFAKTVAELLDETGLDPKLLDLEITEGVLIQNEDAAIALLKKLHDMGIGLSLDDFGTGYSSLSYLRRLPIDTLKIDRSFVQRVDSDPDDGALAGAIIGMARVLRLRVVAEGVETQEQREFLEELGCDEIQGFLFSTPVTAAELADMMRRQAVDGFASMPELPG